MIYSPVAYLTAYPSASGKAGTLACLASYYPELVPRFAVATTVLTQDEYAELLETLQVSPNTPLIVRSSATVEDGTTRSFAGLFESVRCGGGLAEINEALTRVLESGESLSAKYRTKPEQKIEMHCLIQVYVDFAVGGVLFSSDPVAPTKGMLVNLAAGGAEAVVEGTREVTSLHLPYTSPLPRTNALLTRSQQNRLRTYVRALLLVFGYNFDLEFGLVGDALRVVQIRPITTRSAPAEVFLESANIRENFPRPVTPLTYSVLQQMYWETYSELIRHSGASAKQVYAHQDIFRNLLAHKQGYLYYNIGNWYRMAALLPRASENQAGLQAMISGEVSSRLTPQVPLVGKTRYKLILLTKLARFEAKVRRYQARVQELLAAYQFLDYGRFSLSDLHVFWTRISGVIDLETHVNAENDFLLMYFLGRVQDAVDTPTLTQILTAISTEDPVTSKQLTSLRYVREHPEDIAAAVRHVQTYAGRFALDLYLDEPDTSAQTLTQLPRATSPQAAPDPVPLPTLPWRVRLAAKQLAKYIRRREENRLLRSQVFGLMRRLFDAAGEELSRLDALETPGDVQYLTFREIFEYTTLQSFTPDLRPIVTARRAALRDPVSPGNAGKTTYAEFYAGGLTSASTEPAQEYLGCAPGEAEGEAAVLEAGDDARGKILVASRLDPGTVVNLEGVRGLVVEHGGILSHGAILARELGLPAVIGVPDAARHFPTGTRIRINGLHGTITRL